LVGDSSLLWHSYRGLTFADVLLTDAPSVERLRRHGLTQARPALLYGVGTPFLAGGPGQGSRGIDVLFAGHVSPAPARFPLPWLQRLARLADRFRVVLVHDAWGADYRALLRRSRIVFNHSARSELNRRLAESLAGGAMAVVERSNVEVPALLRDG